MTNTPVQTPLQLQVQPQLHLDTFADFETFLAQPEAAERNFEWIDGEVIEKMPSNPYSSHIVQRILFELMKYLVDHPIGVVTGEAGGYRVDGQVLVPDSALTRSKLVHTGFQTDPPDLTIEVISPTDKSEDVRRKLQKYMNAGVTVWVVYPREKTVDIWSPDQPVQTKGLEDVVTFPALLPGFSIAVRRIVADS